MNKQCQFCIHSDVCAYKAHYEDAVELYKKARNECGKYPYFKCDIVCVKYHKKVEPQERSGEVNCNKTECYNCVNHNYCDYEAESDKESEE